MLLFPSEELSTFSGQVHSEHIASLGSVDAEVSVRERLAVWPT